MARRRRKWVLAGLAALAAAGAIYKYYPARPHRPPGGIGCGVPCGVERWSVKTLVDSDAGGVDFSPRPATVSWLIAQPAPANPPADARVAPIETATFTVEARLVGFKRENDRDFHLVLADPDNPAATMIAEIPSANCAGACASSHAADFEAARQELETHFGAPTGQFTPIPAAPRVAVTGVGFFDFLHHQTGVAPNGIELHPVLALRVE